MNVLEDVIPSLIEYLRVNALRRNGIRYSSIYRFFEPGTRQDIVWDTFEEACKRIAPPQQAIYGALLAKKGSNLPSTGFYDIFKNTRHERYMEITGGEYIEAHSLSIEQMQLIAQSERERVHLHAVEMV